MTTQITPKKKIETGNEIMWTGKHWRIYTDVNLYGKEPAVTEKQIEKMLNDGVIKKVAIERNLALLQKHLHKYVAV